MNKVDLNKGFLKRNFVLRLDDIAPNMNWEMMDRVKILFNKYNIKPVIGVIPKNEDKELKSYPKCNFNFWDEIKNLQNQGWEIAMHGYEHVYDKDCKNDYLGHGGDTEFANHPYEVQLNKISLGLKIFNEKNIDIKIFFAPNHTFDFNTIKACKNSGITSIVDGYGISPYHEEDVIFFPQLFYKLVALPFGFQTLQIHLNYYSERDFLKLKRFIEKNSKKIITISQATNIVNNSLSNRIIRLILEKTLKFKRLSLFAQ